LYFFFISRILKIRKIQSIKSDEKCTLKNDYTVTNAIRAVWCMEMNALRNFWTAPCIYIQTVYDCIQFTNEEVMQRGVAPRRINKNHEIATRKRSVSVDKRYEKESRDPLPPTRSKRPIKNIFMGKTRDVVHVIVLCIQL